MTDTERSAFIVRLAEEVERLTAQRNALPGACAKARRYFANLYDPEEHADDMTISAMANNAYRAVCAAIAEATK